MVGLPIGDIMAEKSTRPSLIPFSVRHGTTSMKTPGRSLRRHLAGGLRTQLVLTTVAPITALLVALVLVGIFGSTRLTQTLVEERDSELVQLAAQQVAAYWADSALLLTQVASTEGVRAGDARASRSLLSDNVALAKRFDQIGVVSVHGVMIASVGGEIDANAATMSYFDRARRLRRPVRSNAYTDGRGRSIVAVAVPVYDQWGRFAGCVLGVWELKGEALGLPVANVRVGESGFAYLIDETGTILYHPDRGMIGADSRQHPAVAALVRGETGAQTVSVGGRTRVVGYAPIPLRRLTSSHVADDTWDGWGLLTSELWDDIVAPLGPYVRLMIVLLFLVVTLPLAFVFLNSKRIAAPLQSLVAQAGRVASGEFESQVSIESGPSEVRELGVAFSAMVDQLREYRNDIQSYVVSILTSQEEERKRIARELHDETAQALVVLGRRIEIAQEEADSTELAADLESLRDMVDDTLRGVRRFTSDLRPPLLEELGLPRTLQLLGDSTEQEEPFGVDVSIVGEPRQLLPELELGLYRLAQEGLSNVRKHSQANHAKVSLTYGEDAVKLEISDDGVGFDAPEDPADLIKSGRLGLMGIHERARLFGGKVSITSAAGEGTLVTVDIPITSIVLPESL